MKYDNHLKSALKILDDYEGGRPLAAFLKNFFRQHPQMGSRDRRSVASLVYSYFRLGHTLKNIAREERILAGVFLCENAPSPLLEHFRPAWSVARTAPLGAKMRQLQEEGYPLRLEELFPWEAELSEGMETRSFARSFLEQPQLFIRVRHGKTAAIADIFRQENISFEIIGADCLALPNGTKVEQLLPDKSWYEVQDYASQQTGLFLRSFQTKLAAEDPPPAAWDCCAGSGGKSILLHDLFPQTELYLSDKRPSILRNLGQRFREAGIASYTPVKADLEKGVPASLRNRTFDLILADVPCTGSGTWSRTPEQLCFFDPARLKMYAERQERITGNVVGSLKKKGALLYITCSVFAKENEEVTRRLQERYGLQLLRQGLLKGYDRRADTLFAAAFLNE